MDPDQDLVAGLRAGERSALHEIWLRHGARVHRLCLRILGRRAEAEDATQDVFVRLLERAHEFDGRARFGTWLYRITVNLCLQRLERERRRSAAALPDSGCEPVDPLGPPEEALARAEAGERVARLLARLPPAQRAILVLREIEGLSYRELAQVLSLPPGTVMSRLARARAELVRLARGPQKFPTVETP